MRSGGLAVVPRDGTSGGGDITQNFFGDQAVLYARSQGLGTGIDDVTALNAFFSAMSGNFTEPGLDRGSVGIKGVLPAGSWNGSELGHVILRPATGSSSLILEGQGPGVTVLKAPDRGSGLGCMNSAQHLSAASRLGNTFTLTFTGPWFGAAPTFGNPPSSSQPLCSVFDMIFLKVLSEGVLKWAAFTVTDNNVGGDYTKVRFNAYAPGLAVDGCIPPTGQQVYFVPGFFLHPLNFAQPAFFHLRDLTLLSGSSTGTPLDGLALRTPSRARIAESVVFDGWFLGDCINGSQMPFLLGYGAQQTNHTNSAATYRNCVINSGYVSNSQSGGGSTDGTGGSTRSAVGGGRDNHYRGANMNAATYAHFFVADDGQMGTCDLKGLNTKNAPYVFRCAGVAGIQALEDLGIDCLQGNPKFESPGNGVFEDESLSRTIWDLADWAMRFEAGISIAGAGNNIDFSDRPYHLTNISIASGVLTGTLTESGHGLTKGAAVQIGGGGPSATLDASMDGTQFGPALPTDIVVNEDLVALHFPSAGQVLIASDKGTQLVSYTSITGTHTLHGCTGGRFNTFMATGGGVTSQITVHESIISSVADVTGGSGTSATVAGKTITLPIPDYTGPDVAGPLSCTLGRIFFIRAGHHERSDGTYDWDVDGSDRYAQGCMYYDVRTAGPLTIHLTQNSQASSPRKTLPRFRIRDFERVVGTRGAWSTASGPTYIFTCGEGETEFGPSDVGWAINIDTGGGGSVSATIVSIIDIYNVVLSAPLTSADPSALTWWLSIAQRPDDPRIAVERGTQRYELLHGPVDSNAILAGYLVEAQYTADAMLGARASRADPDEFLWGQAKQPCADLTNGITVTTNGSTGSLGRLVPAYHSFLVMRPGGRNVKSDTYLFAYTGTAPAANDTLVDDGAANPGRVKVRTTGVQRLVAKAAKTGTGGTVPGLMCEERWGS